MIKIYTDGACSGNPGPGGWAFFVVGIGCWSYGSKHTTNNEMELTAIVKAIEWCVAERFDSVEILSDSAYCINGATQWLNNWVHNHWRTSSGSRIKNCELWQQYHRLVYKNNINVTFTKVKGHSGDVGNDYVDKKAKEAMEKVL